MGVVGIAVGAVRRCRRGGWGTKICRDDGRRKIGLGEWRVLGRRRAARGEVIGAAGAGPLAGR